MSRCCKLDQNLFAQGAYIESDNTPVQKTESAWLRKTNAYNNIMCLYVYVSQSSLIYMYKKESVYFRILAPYSLLPRLHNI